jgi:hypothetical protein
VLVVDDIHWLTKGESGASGSYSREAIDELVSFAQKQSHCGVVVLTGHTEGVNNLLAQRRDLAGILQEEIIFDPLSPKESLDLLDSYLKSEKVLAPFFTSPEIQTTFERAMSLLSLAQSWSNATDIAKLARSIILAIPYEMWEHGPFSGDLVCISEEIPLACIKAMFQKKVSWEQSIMTASNRARRPSPSSQG